MANTKKYISLDKLGVYDELIKAHIKTGDTDALANAKAYADGLATNYDPAGSAAGVQAKLDEEVLRAKAAEEANAAAAKKAQDEVDALELVVQNIQENAYDDTEVRNLITDLSENKADKTQVATDIAAAVKVEEEARIAAVAGVQAEVDALEQTHATDKAALEASIATKATQTALDEVSAVANAAATKTALDEEIERAQGEEARIEGLVEAEVERAAGVESGLNERLTEVEAFFKLAEGETLDTALDTLVEIQKYVTDEGAAADQMVKDIAANTKAIEDHIATDHDFAAADEALKAELNTEIAKKADKTTVKGIDGRLTTAEGKISANEQAIAALQGEDTTIKGRLDSLETAIGDSGSVAEDISTAKQEAIDAAALDATTKANTAESNAKAYTDAEIDKVEETIATLTTTVGTKASQADLTALAGRVTTAEGEIDTLQTEMDAVEALAAANKAAHEANAAAIALKASQADLNAVSDRVTTLETWHSNFVEVSEEEINGLFA